MTSSLSAKSHVSYRPDVDGLRALAVLVVIVFHAFPGIMPGGFVGVDVFFVISGYLITGNLMRLPRIDIRDFYVRRIRRIFPALAVVLWSTLAISWFLLTPVELAALGKHTAAGAFSLANIALWREAGYFDSSSETKPLLHLWSLGVEEQFYLAWPLLIAALRHRQRFLVPTLGFLIVLSFLGCLWGTFYRPSAAFYLPMSRFWELGLGGLLAIRELQSTSLSPRLRSVASAIGLSLILLALVFVNQSRAFPGLWALAPVLGSAALIFGGPETPVARYLLGRRLPVAMGLISYPLYLWHWPLLAVARSVLRIDLAFPIALFICAFSFLLATLTYRLLEIPLRRRGSPLLLVLAVTTVGLLGCALAYTDTFGGAKTSEVHPSREATCPPSLAPDGPAHLELCRASGIAAPAVALVGDSHANHLFAALSALDHRSWLLLGHPSCPPVFGVRVEGDQPNCQTKFEHILQFFQQPESASVRTVVLGLYSGYALEDAVAADHLQRHTGPPLMTLDGKTTKQEKQVLLEKGLTQFIRALLQTQRTVVLLEDTPEFPFFPNQCVTQPPLRVALRTWLDETVTCSIAKQSVLKRQADYLAMTQRIVQQFPQVRLVHLLDLLCADGVCPMRVGNELWYGDSHHLSPAGAQHVARDVLAVLPGR